MANVDWEQDMKTEMLTTRDIAPADWPGLSRDFRDLTFEQTRAYAIPGAARVGAKARFVAVEKAGKVVALAALRVRNLPGLGRGIVWIPAGPMIMAPDRAEPDNAERASILAALRKRIVEQEGNILRLRLSSLSFVDQDQGAEAAARAGFAATGRAQSYKTYALDIRQGEEELMRRLNGKWRGNLRNALKGDLRVEHSCGEDLTDRFEAVFASVQEAKGFTPAISAAFHRACRAEDYQLETFVISKDGVDLGAGMMVVTGKNANYLYGATNEAGRPLRAGYQLTWAMILRCVALELTWLDLGGVDVENNPEVAGYKERVGGPYVEGAGPYEATPSGLFPRLVTGLETLRARLRAGAKG
jgi:lipid II:glycine glycyltransferase (peptidoglycan interpeptide bridge formation enzyme)